MSAVISPMATAASPALCANDPPSFPTCASASWVKRIFVAYHGPSVQTARRIARVTQSAADETKSPTTKFASIPHMNPMEKPTPTIGPMAGNVITIGAPTNQRANAYAPNATMLAVPV